ncbi:unnamed protein product [Ilex paraguariensis]|uniref:Bet v I/Major latex protein domain-containing protein n=1 Tax=Ilex paraguariensis TaxID=185542 RepID=A0ABC8SK81_9AQUA
MGKLVAQTEIMSDGDVFHEIFRYRPHHIKNLNGELWALSSFGTTPMIRPFTIALPFNHTRPFRIFRSIDGKEKVAKKIIQAIDEEKKSVTFKLIEGDLMELYKTFIATVHVDTKGENILVTWTFEFEKLNEGVEDPNTLMDLCLAITKDIEAYHPK